MRYSMCLFLPLLLTAFQLCLGSYDDGRENSRVLRLNSNGGFFRSLFGKLGGHSGGSGGYGGAGGSGGNSKGSGGYRGAGASGGGSSGGLRGGGFGGARGINGAFRRTANDERYPPLGDSYWIPYGDRTVAAMSFPVVTHDLFTPVVIEEVLLPLGKAKSLYSKANRIMKTKSDFGVVVSRNSVLKRNFRDYANLSRYDGDSRAPDELLIDLAKELAHSQSSTKNGQTFVAVAFESRLKRPTREEFSGAVRDSRVLHNGTLIFPSKQLPGILTTIPFTLKSLKEVEEIFEDYNGLEIHEKMQTKSFVKLLAGIHKDTFEDGRDALERFEQRSRRLLRPVFDVPVENSTGDPRDDPDDRQRREEILRIEGQFREEAWFSTHSIGIRSISPPQFVENLVPIVPHAPFHFEKPVELFRKPKTHHSNDFSYAEKEIPLKKEAAASSYSSNHY